MRTETVHAVIWDDAHGSTAMFDAAEVEHKPYRFTSIGFLIRSDEVGVSLAGEVGDDGRYRDHEFVPRAMVVTEWSVGPLRPKKERKRDVRHSTAVDDRGDTADPK